VVELLPLVGIALLFWLFIIRPATKRQRELRGMQSSLSVGDQIVLTSGVYGTVTSMEDAYVLVEIADGVTIKVARGAVGTIETKAEQPYEDHEDFEPDVSVNDDGPGSPADGSEEK
jgi:preprotein translocase subunit YajC